MFPALERFIYSQKWLDTVADPVQKYINSLFAGGGSARQVKNVLNGVWLGHPLHPMVTDVPVGAWTATLVLDGVSALSGSESLATAADLTLATGLAGAISSAASGFTDWSDTYGKERTLGLAHGLMMGATTTAYLGSLLARLVGARSAGVALANTGYALLAAGAYLGGDEVYDVGYGVNHTAFEHQPAQYVSVMPEAELPADTPTKADADGLPILLVKLGSQIYALDDTCVHAGCSLAGGHLEGATIVCPCHGSQYDLRDGSVINGPATMPEPHYDVRIQGSMIQVKHAAVEL
jgi:nitrite reductase/ring-hydroxylating ferredoxin subunit/uncharacterized membrane protein